MTICHPQLRYDSQHHRAAILEEISSAHEALLALFAGAHDRDRAAIIAALERLEHVGERLGCPRLTFWCVGPARVRAEEDLEVFAAASLPALVGIWEDTLNATISRVFPRDTIGARLTALTSDSTRGSFSETLEAIRPE
jgi:hypothetical protein